MTVQKHKHAELIHAWADGAIIQHFYKDGNLWKDSNFPSFLKDISYRIKPDCEYAIDRIRNLGGDEAADLYIYWLDGGELETKPLNTCWKDADFNNQFDNNPFEQFKELFKYWDGNVRKKKKTVKQVLWICIKDEKYYGECYLCEDEYLDGPEEFTWHEVPTCTREVEV